MVGGIAAAMFATALVVGAQLGTGAAIVTVLAAQELGHLGTFMLLLRRKQAPASSAGLVVEPRDGRFVLLGVAMQFGLALAFGPIVQRLELDESSQAIAEMIPEVTGPVLQALLVLLVGLVTPIVEETMFRGILLNVTERRLGRRWAVIIPALVFSVFHLAGVASEDLGPALLVLVPQLFLVGSVLGILSLRHGRIGPAIFTHAGFNLVALASLLWAPSVL